MRQIRQTKANDLPLFAQPVEDRATSAIKPGKSRALHGIALLAVCTTAGAALMLLPKANHAQNLTPGAVNRPGPTIDPAANVNPVHRRSIDFYVHSVRDSLFSPPAPPAPVIVPIKFVKPPVVVVKHVNTAPLPVVEVNPFADWAYKGTVHLGDDTMALLENTKTNEGQYVHVGDSFIGGQVSAITDQQVTLSSAGKPMLLAKSDAMNVVPLDKSADFLKGGQQTAGGPPPPAASPAPAAPQPGGPPGWARNPDGSMTMPNGRVITADQMAARAARRANRMNNNFNN